MSEQSFICRSPSLALPPEPLTPPPSVEKLSSTKLALGARKVGDRCSRIYQYILGFFWQVP